MLFFFFSILKFIYFYLLLLLCLSFFSQVVKRFQELFAQTKYKEAAELAAQSPQGVLRTPDTVAKFQVFYASKCCSINISWFC